MISPSIIGTWSLVDAWDMGGIPSDPTQKTYPWGNPPAGYWVFDRSGHFSLMISQNPALQIPVDPYSGNPQPQWLNPTAPWEVPYALLIETFSTANPFAYFGTYSVAIDEKNPNSGTILMNIFSDVLRVYTNQIEKRPFTFESNDIVNVGVAGQYMRVLRRLT
jgi:hypothetical protein